eukprot:COSAG05_NODE_49_length_24373_cov_16.162561_28_plen_55_part_00
MAFVHALPAAAALYQWRYPNNVILVLVYTLTTVLQVEFTQVRSTTDSAASLQIE